MDREAIRTQFVEKICAQFGKQPAEIHDEDHLAKVYGAKSHDLIQLSASLQAALGLKLNYATTRKCKTVGEWVDLLASQETKK